MPKSNRSTRSDHLTLLVLCFACWGCFWKSVHGMNFDQFPVESQLPDHYRYIVDQKHALSPSVSIRGKSKEEWLLESPFTSLSARRLKTWVNYKYFERYSVDLCSFSQSMNNQPTDPSVWQLSRLHYSLVFFLCDRVTKPPTLLDRSSNLSCLPEEVSQKCPPSHIQKSIWFASWACLSLIPD